MKKLVAASTVLFGITFLFGSCSKESLTRAPNSGEQNAITQNPGTQTIAATVAKGNSYILNLGTSASATIIKQAMHYQVSETVSSEGDGGLKYRYTPAADYAGADEVMINYTSTENVTSGNCLGNNSHPSTVTSKYITIKLNVTN